MGGCPFLSISLTSRYAPRRYPTPLLHIALWQFRVESTKPDGTIFEHHVKPLQLIWSKLGESKYGPHNTVHVDDLSRNFALNKSCGLKCTAYYRKKKAAKGDVELRDMAVYLVKLAGIEDFETVEHGEWMKVVEGKKDISGGEKKKS